MSEPAYVLDSTAFYAGIPYQGSGRYFTTYLVLEEVRHRNVGSSLIHSRVQVTEPTQGALDVVRNTAANTGDMRVLSQSDISLLALAFDLARGAGGACLVSDDFAVRNVADKLSIPLASTSLKGGEWKSIAWKAHCRGCGKEYANPNLTVCPVCGTQLARKASGGRR